MTSLAQKYATTAKYFAYASPQENARENPRSAMRFLNDQGQAIKPSFRHIQVSCIAHSSLQVVTIPYPKQDPSQEDLYKLCMQKQLLDSSSHLFMAMPLVSLGAMQQYKAFASALDTQGKPTSTAPRIYENLNAQVFIPLILLPLASDEKASGVFLLDDWLCVYDNSKLVYECVCSDMASLRDALAFISSMYGTPSKLYYYQALSTSTSLYPLESTLESTLQASYPTLTCITTPLYQLLQAYLHTALPTLYNPHAKQLLQTSSFWQGLGLVACCVLILALPFCKLLYASYLDHHTSDLQVHNTQLTQTLKSQNLAISKLPHQNTQITDTIHQLYTIKSRYTSRLEILSTLSQIARKHESWITYLQLNGGLEKGETLLELSCQSQSQENLQTLLLSLQQSLNLEIISTEEEPSSDVFGTKITLKIGYA